MIPLTLLGCGAMFALLAGLLFVNSIIVFNTVRYMAAAPTMLWRDPQYVGRLPNFLKRLYDAEFLSPWPERPTALAAHAFRRRLQRLLTADFPGADQFIQQHLSLWAFVQLHRDELRSMVCKRQIARARRLLAESADAALRSRLLLLLNRCRADESTAAGKNPPPASTCETIPWVARLRSFDILLREHGYQICDEFSTLDHWEDADDTALLDELAAGITANAQPGST